MTNAIGTKKKIAKNGKLENEKLIVEINGNGTGNVTDKQTGKEYKGINYLSSQGEIGNAWKHQEPENDKLYTSKNSFAKVELLENGPLSATYKAEFEFSVPKECLETQSEELVQIPVTVYYTLQADSSKLDIKVELVNKLISILIL